MKILVASVNHEHPNTMHINYCNSLAEVTETDFFGPGFSTKEELEQGIKKYVELHGPYDTVICPFSMMLSMMEISSIQDIYKWHRYFLSDYSVAQAVRYCGQIISDIYSIDLVKIVLFDQDMVNLPKIWYDYLRKLFEKGFYIISPGLEFVPIRSQDDDTTFGEGLTLNNLYRSLLEEYPDRIISIPVQAAICSEFFFGPLIDREYDWVVPGNIDGCYPMRGEILRRVEQEGYKIFSNFIDRTMVYKTDESRTERCQYQRKIDRIIDENLGRSNSYLLSTFKREEIARWRENYNVSLRSSKVAYADSGEGHMIVRKYIEVPARGTLMMCENIPGLDALGFQDGENMVVVTSENVVEVSRELFKNPEKMQQIARNGQKLVTSKHTTHMRVECTVKAIKRILEGNYKGSYWKHGEFIVAE